MKRLIFFSGMIIISLFSGCIDYTPNRFGEVRVTPLDPGIEGIATTSVCRLASGEWLMFATRPNTHSPGSTMFVTKSDDEGKSWSPADTAAVLPRRVATLAATQLSDGGVTVLYGLQRSRAADAPPLGSFLIRSYDHGATFTTPQPIIVKDTEGILPSSGILEGPEGEWIFFAEANKGGLVQPLMLISDDLGNTWQTRALIQPGKDKRILFSRPMPAGEQDEKLVCLLKSEESAYLYLTRTIDLGQTWTVPSGTPFLGKNVRLLFTRHGTLAVIYEDATPRGLTLRLSYDFGHSWEKEMPLIPLSVGNQPPISYSVMETETGIAIFFIQAQPNPALMLARVPISPPLAPKGLSASVKNNTVSLRWNPIDHTAFYLVYRDGASNFTPRLPDQPQSNLVGTPIYNRFVDAGLDSNQTVFYRVCGVRGSGPLIENTGSIGELSDTIRVQIP